ncbi:MAG TPA: TnsA-like heteromeric transposase endonuclease subunit [Streptosporangiaceae bacterium]|jgi:hypothetical protein
MLARQGARVKAPDPVAWIRYDDGSVHEFTLDRLRLGDFAGSVPWRQVRSRHGDAHYCGSYASATTGGFVIYESRLELARLLLADFDPLVQQIYAQPFRLVACAGGRVRRHVPDFLLVTKAGTARLVNVKPAARLQDPVIAEALAWPGVLAEEHGWEYEVWSGADVTLLDNVRFLAGYRRAGVVPAEEVERAWQLVRDGEQLADAELRLAGERPRHEARPALLALLWAGRLVTDLTRPLSGESVLRRPA